VGLHHGEAAIKIAAAAQETVKHLSHVALGQGDIDRILSQTSHGSMSIEARIHLAQNLAQDIAKAYLEQPRNRFDATSQDPAGQRFALNLPLSGLNGLPRFGGADAFAGEGAGSGAEGGSGGSGSGSSSGFSSASSGARSNYGAMGYNAPLSSMGVGSPTFASTPFAGAAAAVGINQNTLKYVASKDPIHARTHHRLEHITQDATSRLLHQN
jgi:hypothetical protein